MTGHVEIFQALENHYFIFLDGELSALSWGKPWFDRLNQKQTLDNFAHFSSTKTIDLTFTLYNVFNKLNSKENYDYNNLGNYLNASKIVKDNKITAEFTKKEFSAIFNFDS